MVGRLATDQRAPLPTRLLLPDQPERDRGIGPTNRQPELLLVRSELHRRLLGRPQYRPNGRSPLAGSHSPARMGIWSSPPMAGHTPRPRGERATREARPTVRTVEAG